MTELTDESEFRINKAIDYIDENLHEQLSLKVLSNISCFSEFHFHRLFQKLTGQPPGSYIKRLRMKKAMTLLSGKKSLPISSISELCGYSTASNFSKTFSEYYGVSPSTIKSHFHINNIKDYNALIHKDFADTKLKEKVNCESLSRYHNSCRSFIGDELYEKLLSIPDIQTEKIDSLTYMYSRHFGSYTDKNLFQKMLKHFSYAHEVYKKYPDTSMLGVFLDCPNFTQNMYCRSDAGITIPDDFDDYKLIGKRKIAPGLYATLTLELPPKLSRYIWCYLKAEWLINTSYEVDDRPSFCRYAPIPNVPISEKIKIKFFMPVSIG